MTRKKEDAIRIDGKKAASELLGSLDERHREKILTEIASRDPDLASHLRKGLFQFEHVIRLDPSDLQKVIRIITPSLLALALRGLDSEQKKTLYSKLSERQSRTIEEEIESIGPSKMSDVKQAREKIIEQARTLHESGDIRLF
jgi:flagellar motor switch protein FliG